MGSTDISADAQEGNEEFSHRSQGSGDALSVLLGQSLKRVTLVGESGHRR